MNVVELKATREALASKLAELTRITATCDHCEHFAHAPRCAKFEAIPPEDFRRTPEACEHWKFDGIPF